MPKAHSKWSLQSKKVKLKLRQFENLRSISSAWRCVWGEFNICFWELFFHVGLIKLSPTLSFNPLKMQAVNNKRRFFHQSPFTWMALRVQMM